MEIDLARFERLLRDITAARAESTGYNSMLQDLERRRNGATGELARAEEQVARMPPPRRAPHRLPSGAGELGNDALPLRDTAERREAQLVTLRRMQNGLLRNIVGSTHSRSPCTPNGPRCPGSRPPVAHGRSKPASFTG